MSSQFMSSQFMSSQIVPTQIYDQPDVVALALSSPDRVSLCHSFSKSGCEAGTLRRGALAFLVVASLGGCFSGWMLLWVVEVEGFDFLERSARSTAQAIGDDDPQEDKVV